MAREVGAVTAGCVFVYVVGDVRLNDTWADPGRRGGCLRFEQRKG